MNIFTKIIADALSLPERGVENTLELLEENCTIPFISRYRKERTGGLDEVQVSDIALMREKLMDIEKRKQTIIATIEDLGKVTDELRRRIDQCWNMSELEDIYLPYKPKRRTKADIARQQGLEPLAQLILLQRENDPEGKAERFVKGDVKSAADALQGAKYIIAETINEDEKVRRAVRGVFKREAVITSKVVKTKAEEEGAQKYSDYFDFSEPLRHCSSHRLLAMRRGEKEGFLRVSISADDDVCKEKVRRSMCWDAESAADWWVKLPTTPSSACSSLPWRRSLRSRASRQRRLLPSASLRRTCVSCCWLPLSDRSA